jgi:hypothetical protein
MGQSQTFYRFDWSKRLTALQGGVHDFPGTPFRTMYSLQGSLKVNWPLTTYSKKSWNLDR